MREDRAPGSSQEGTREPGVVGCLGVLQAVERQRARDVHLLSGPKMFTFEETFLTSLPGYLQEFYCSDFLPGFLVWEHITQGCLHCSQGGLSYCLKLLTNWVL